MVVDTATNLTYRPRLETFEKCQFFKGAKLAADVLFFENFHDQQVSSFLSLQDLISKIGISAACNTPAATLP